MAPQSNPFDLPGLTLPVNFRPKGSMFPNALDGSDIEDGYCGYIFTTRELLMMRIMEAITDKPDWDTKVLNKEITKKWREEISQSGHDVTPRMMDYILEELQWKAEEYKKTGIVTAYDPGVVKSDVAIPRDLQEALRKAVAPLEDVPEEEKDYHPRSDKKVVDLVHPSLFPLVYGRTRVLRDKLIRTVDCFSSVGQGEVAKVPDYVPIRGLSYNNTAEAYSTKFQWLPCNANFEEDGQCQIASYINNLHPEKHKDLYSVIQQILTRAIPLWNISLSRRRDIPRRIPYLAAEYHDDEPEPEQGSDEDDDDYWNRYEQWQERRKPVYPDTGTFQPPDQAQIEQIDLRERFGKEGLQVIVKLANIELTPEKPRYEGGAWHIEGQLNERICATAIYYYDSDNITDNTLSFRHRGDDTYFHEFGYEQGEFQFLEVFGFDTGAADYGGVQITQDLGSVSTRAGRLLTFPNTLQHRVSPFSLDDRSKPGHRKILALFLIDPTRRIISTANVPPQREDWCDEWKEATAEALARRLPIELQDMVQKDVGFEPMTMDEAKEYRLELMDERTANSEVGNQAFETGGFSLCEH